MSPEDQHGCGGGDDDGSQLRMNMSINDVMMMALDEDGDDGSGR